MTRLRFGLSCAILLAAAGCHGDAVTNSPVVPMAAIHWVNAQPDTARMDFRVVDIVSNAGLYGAAFRSSNMFYQGLQSGARHILVFYDTTDVTIAQTVFSDTTATFATDQGYTFIEAGFARTAPPSPVARAVWIVSDASADPGAGNVGVRVIHAGVGMGNLDVFLIRHQADTLALPVPVATNVAYGTIGSYGTIAADTGTQTMRIAFTATGTTTPIVGNVAFPVGAAGSDTLNPIAGARVPGSVLTAVLVAPSVVGSHAPAGFTTPGAVFLVDRRPPNTAP